MIIQPYHCTLHQLISEMNSVIDDGTNKFVQPAKAIDEKTLNDFLEFCKNKNINVNYEEKIENKRDSTSHYHEFKFAG